MGAGQIMLTIAAVLLLSTTILTVNRGLMNTSSVLSSSRYDIMAVSLGNSILEDASSLAFDEKTTSAALTDSTQLTAPSSLGIDAGESNLTPAAFDDFDGYNVYNTSISGRTPKADTIIVEGVANKKIIFKTICKVDYVSTSNPGSTSSVRTWSKRLKLLIYSDDVLDPATSKTDTVKLSTVFSYWYQP